MCVRVRTWLTASRLSWLETSTAHKLPEISTQHPSACYGLLPCVCDTLCVCMLMLLTNALTRTIFHILQGVRRRAVWPHRGERVLHGEGREHANPTSPGRCELPAQDGHRPPRPEGTAAHTLTHSHTLSPPTFSIHATASLSLDSQWFTAAIRAVPWHMQCIVGQRGTCRPLEERCKMRRERGLCVSVLKLH